MNRKQQIRVARKQVKNRTPYLRRVQTIEPESMFIYLTLEWEKLLVRLATVDNPYDRKYFVK